MHGVCGEFTIKVSDVEWENRNYSGALPNNFSACVRVRCGEAAWLHEPYFPIGEFVLQCEEWLERDAFRMMLPMTCVSLDDEDPVLTMYCFERDVWVLSSRLGAAGALSVAASDLERELRAVVANFYTFIRANFALERIAW